MKKNLKKGFTLTELVVVIVIIGILASVLIPTLTSYITRARKSAAEQEATGRLQEFMAYVLDYDNEAWFQVNEYVKAKSIAVKTDKYYVVFENGAVDVTKTSEADPSADALLTYTGNSASLVYLLAAKANFANDAFTKDVNNESDAIEVTVTVATQQAALLFKDLVANA